MADKSIQDVKSPKEVVRAFVIDIRSGKRLDRVANYMAPKVIAHQIWAEGGSSIERSPSEYRAHIEDFQAAFGNFSVTIEEILADEDRVFVRWRQDGFHMLAHGEESPSGKPLTEITSTVYRVKDGRIVEYWLQTDRMGMSNQVHQAQE